MKILLLFFVLVLSGCGAWDRFSSNVTGSPSEICYDKVTYLMFTTGATVKYTPDGKIESCK